ncbi:hypothetical protein SLH46_16580 [Draconibacterium sp. IB214405]|uniref:hypothetical protein n=1 Tax=Draconibacterium sp. IB214405 TaxID=3097352 RepID=UPI002A111C92|nr:hypothetical protein [Draconibacterium sp. IB214405]MDX8340815.1 hypothetical protein [Draconibacterium sp. IB214405]
MDSYIKYKIFPESRFIVEFMMGDLDYELFLDHKKRLFNDDEHDENYCVLSVLSHSKILLTADDVERYKSYLTDNKKVVGTRKVAVLTDTPKHVVISTIYKNAVKEFPMRFKIFSTYSAALQWLNVSEEYESKILELFYPGKGKIVR